MPPLLFAECAGEALGDRIQQVVDGSPGLVEDEEGTELPDLAAAFAEALRCTRELMEDVSASGGLQLEIADEAGRIVLMVPIYGTGGSNPRKEQAHAA